MNNIYALMLTLVVGLFFLIGFVLVYFVKKKNELVVFSTGMAFVIMLGMVLLDLLPEIIEMSENMTFNASNKLTFLFSFMIVGILILRFFDKVLPHHHHEHQLKEDLKEHNHHLYHIGFITTFSLILHNILEGMSIYIIGVENITTALLMTIAVGFHNIPLGIEIASSMSKIKYLSKLKYIMLILLVMSSSFGAFGLFFFGSGVSPLVLIALICVACGMIFYIAVFELLPEIFNYKKEKLVYIGMVVGVITITMMTFLE